MNRAELVKTDAEQRVLIAEQRATEAEQRAVKAVERARAAEARAAAAEERAQADEHRAIVAEQRAQSAERLVTASERRAQAEEHWAIAAGQRAQSAERLAAAAEQQAQAAEQRASTIEPRALAAEQRAAAAEQRAAAAEQRAAAAEERAQRPTGAAQPSRDEVRRQQRVDLVRRFIAVAISVGFASSLVVMPWVTSGTWPSLYGEGEHLARLAAALFIVIVGWDWYSRDAGRPSFALFVLDIVVVVANLLFLVSSRDETQWLLFLAVIFALYVAWDVLNLSEMRRAATPEEQRLCEDRKKARLLNLAWFAFFAGLFVVAWWFPASVEGRAFVLSLFAIASVYVLRRDGDRKRTNDWREWTARLAGMAGALALLGLYLAFAPPAAAALEVTRAELTPEGVIVAGRTPQPHQQVSIGAISLESDARGAFRFALTALPIGCIVELHQGGETRAVFIRYCSPRGEAGSPGAPGKPGPKGDPGQPGGLGDNVFSDTNASGVKLCALHNGGRVIKSEQSSFTFGGQFTDVVVVPKAWPGEACLGLFGGVSPDVRLGCMFADRPFVTWATAPSLTPEARNCGW